MNASAPGKIILCGEYVVLDGEAAVVMSVNRRARATIADQPQPPSIFLRAAADEIRRAFGSRSAEADAIGRVRVDTSSLSEGGDKIGLGSSAAATVAAIACSLSTGGIDRLDTRERAQVLILAQAAHAAAQVQLGGHAGSGADVYAAVAGGINVYRQIDGRADADPIALPDGAEWIAVWTKKAANTRDLVAAVRSFRDADAAGYSRCAEQVSNASTQLIDACRSGDAQAVVAAVDAGARAVGDLGKAAGVELETQMHRRIAEIAQAAGGAAKPTGAGGGDIAVAVFAETSQASQFRDDLRSEGIEALDVTVDIDGVRLHA